MRLGPPWLRTNSQGESELFFGNSCICLFNGANHQSDSWARSIKWASRTSDRRQSAAFRLRFSNLWATRRPLGNLPTSGAAASPGWKSDSSIMARKAQPRGDLSMSATLSSMLWWHWLDVYMCFRISSQTPASPHPRTASSPRSPCRAACRRMRNCSRNTRCPALASPLSSPRTAPASR